MKPYQYVLRTLLILALLDIIVLAAFIWRVNATPDVSIGELLFVPAIAIVNVVLAFIVYYWLRNASLSIAFLYNAVIAPVIFHYLFHVWFIYYDNAHFKSYYFKSDGKQYEITLQKQYHAFTLSDISDQQNGSTTGLMMGDYFVLADSIVLTDGTNRLVIYNHHLKGYPKGDDIMVLKEKND